MIVLYLPNTTTSSSNVIIKCSHRSSLNEYQIMIRFMPNAINAYIQFAYHFSRNSMQTPRHSSLVGDQIFILGRPRYKACKVCFSLSANKTWRSRRIACRPFRFVYFTKYSLWPQSIRPHMHHVKTFNEKVLPSVLVPSMLNKFGTGRKLIKENLQNLFEIVCSKSNNIVEVYSTR